MSTVIGYTDTVAQIKSANKDALALVERELSFTPSGARFTKAYKYRAWDGRISYLSKPDLRFSAGFVPYIYRVLDKRRYIVQLADQRKKLDWETPTREEISNWLESLEGIERRDFQAEAVHRFLLKRRGIISAPTGSGKTVMMAAAINFFPYKHLLMTHRSKLLSQTYKRFREYFKGSKSVVKFGQPGWKEADVVIATVQSIQARLAKEKSAGGRKLNRYKDPKKAEEVIQYLKTVEALSVDEVHRCSAEGFQEAIKLAQNTVFRLGVYATPYRSGKEHRLKVMSAIGSVVYEIGKEKLIGEGLLARPHIKFVTIRKPKVPRGFRWDKVYRWGIVNHSYRNEVVVQEAIKLAKGGDKVLILVVQIDHGYGLKGMLEEKGWKTEFVHGGTSEELSDEVTAAFEGKGLDIVIMSTIADEGIDIPIISAAILAGGWKSVTRFIQRVGRGGF